MLDRLLRTSALVIGSIIGLILLIYTLVALVGETSWSGPLLAWVFFGLGVGGTLRAFRALSERTYGKLIVPDREHWAALGSTPEERARNIDAFFDAQKGTLSVGARHEFRESPNKSRPQDIYFCHIQFRISRSFASMEPRERELLKVVYHLYNGGIFGEQQWQYYRFAFIYGSGKASIDSWDYYCPESTGVKDGVSAVRYYHDLVDGSVDAAVNALLGVLEQVPQDQLPKSVRAVQKRIHGGGTWLAEDEIDESPFTVEDVPGALLGDLEESGQTVRFASEGSMITVAPPGSGKTQCHVFPTLLTWVGPAVVLDVKGEIYEGTSKWRAENVGPVYKFSPLDPANSHGYNPLTAVRSDPDYLWEDSRFLADMMIVPTEAKDPFWETRARDVLTAAIAKVCLQEDAEKRSVGDVLDVFHGVGWEDFVLELQSRVEIRSMARAGNSLGNMERKTRDSVLQTGLSSLSAWDGERIDRATRKSDWSPLDLRGGGNPTVYICLKPNEVESYISILRVFIAQHIRTLTTELPPRGAHPILFMLDELPRLKYMPPVEEALEIGRQYGIKLWMFTQSLGQLRTAYQNADGMIGQCAVQMYMNPSLHDETAQKLSEDIGMQEGVLDRERQKVVEAAALAGPEFRDNIIVMAGGTKPLKLKKHFAWQDEELNGRMGKL